LEFDHQLIGQKVDQPIVDGRIKTRHFFCFKSTEDALALLMSEWLVLTHYPRPSRESNWLVLLLWLRVIPTNSLSIDPKLACNTALKTILDRLTVI
jgi:hypothetical protein